MWEQPKLSQLFCDIGQVTAPGPQSLLSCERLRLVLSPPKHIQEHRKTAETSGTCLTRPPRSPTLQGSHFQEAGCSFQAPKGMTLGCAPQPDGEALARTTPLLPLGPPHPQPFSGVPGGGPAARPWRVTVFGFVLSEEPVFPLLRCTLL